MRLTRFLALATFALHLLASSSPAAPSQPSPQTKSPPVKSPAKPAPKPVALLPLDEGELDAGARFAIARPLKWNGSVLLIAHGLRDETDPLVADLFPDRLAYKTLRDEGWIIAKTSYRRNGMIITDAVADIENLRAYIAKTYGDPKRVVVEGDSMGGLIATIIAEQPPGDFPKYHGCVAIGAALGAREPNGTLGINLGTQLPLIFLTNRSEITGPKSYVNPLTPLPPNHRSVKPVLFKVSRDGHVNVNQQERLTALRALNDWLDRGVSSLPKPADGAEFFDATHQPEPQPSLVTFDADRRGFITRVTEITEVYGNIAINAQPADFASAGIARNAWFQTTAHDEIRRVMYGRDFSAVKRGEWVAFPNADGFFWLARNFENAAKTANLQVGDEIHIRAYDKDQPASE
ncbi:MAG: SAM-dependent chlorinase/fluorinase [Nibricoccus sp.]